MAAQELDTGTSEKPGEAMAGWRQTTGDERSTRVHQRSLPGQRAAEMGKEDIGWPSTLEVG